MSDRDRQRKFDQQSNIKSSEFNRHNTNMTRQTNPIGKGQNLLPTDNKYRKVETKDLIFRVVSVIIAIGVYLLVMFLGKVFLPKDIYMSMAFFIFDLCFSIITVYLFFLNIKNEFHQHQFYLMRH
jgi:hypothetical protein